MYCLACAKRAIAVPPGSDDPVAVLEALLAAGEAGDRAASRFFFGILWDEGRTILCYRCRRARPVRLAPDQVAALERSTSRPR